MSQNDQDNLSQRDRPIADAAAAVEDTANKARAMMEQLERGRLWRLLCTPPDQKPKV